jgi:hypothetical protein
MSVASYAKWEVRDYIVHRLPVSLFLCALLLAPAVARARNANLPPGYATQHVEQDLLPLCALALVLFAIHGVVGADRASGLERLWSTRPVSMVGFYLQRYLLFGVLTVLVSMLIAACAGIFLTGQMAWSLPIGTGFLYLLLGGIGFLSSVVIRFDSITILVTWLIGVMLQESAKNGGSFVSFVKSIFPPVWLMDVFSGKSAEPSLTLAMLTCAAYGGTAILLGALWIKWGPRR